MADLADALARRLPRGSGAKLEALERGTPPPGSDPEVSARLHLDRPTLGLSCWVHAGLLVAASAYVDEVVHAGVLVLSRVDPASPPVDFHGCALVETASGQVVSDTFFDAASVPAGGGHAQVPGSWVETVDLDGVVTMSVSQCWAVGPLRYRQVSVPVTPHHVEPFCQLSATHGSVRSRTLGLRTPRGLINVAPARNDRIGGYRVTRWDLGPTEVRGTPVANEQVGTWDEAVELAFDLRRSAGAAG
jgi:hypothetical protein